MIQISILNQIVLTSLVPCRAAEHLRDASLGWEETFDYAVCQEDAEGLWGSSLTMATEEDGGGRALRGGERRPGLTAAAGCRRSRWGGDSRSLARWALICSRYLAALILLSFISWYGSWDGVGRVGLKPHDSMRRLLGPRWGSNWFEQGITRKTQ
jgi:hypothetical protein